MTLLVIGILILGIMLGILGCAAWFYYNFKDM